MTLTNEHMDMLAMALIPILDKVGDMAQNKKSPAYVFKDQPEGDPDYRQPPPEALGFAATDTGGFTLPEADRLQLAIQGQAVMVISTLEQTPDGSSRIVLSPLENWVVKSVLMNGLDSSMEIELILAPRI